MYRFIIKCVLTGKIGYTSPAEYVNISEAQQAGFNYKRLINSIIPTYTSVDIVDVSYSN